MAKFVGLLTATLLVILGTQAEPITGTLAFVWAGLHFVALIKAWYADNT
jgi:hypothetical protein